MGEFILLKLPGTEKTVAIKPLAGVDVDQLLVYMDAVQETDPGKMLPPEEIQRLRGSVNGSIEHCIYEVRE